MLIPGELPLELAAALETAQSVVKDLQNMKKRMSKTRAINLEKKVVARQTHNVMGGYSTGARNLKVTE